MAKKAQKRASILACTEDGSPVVEIYSMQTEGDKLIMDCKALDSMRMNVVISADDIAKGWPVIAESKGSIIAFAKKLPKAIRKGKKERKEQASLQS